MDTGPTSTPVRGGGRVVPLEEFYRVTYPRLLRVLFVAAGQQAEAEEVLQEAFVKLIPRWDRISRYDDPEAWVRQVAFRLLSNRRRGLLRRHKALDRLPLSVEQADLPWSHLDVTRALASLTLAHRQVAVLHHMVGLPLEEVALVLDVPIGTVKSRLSRARALLTPLLVEDTSWT